MNEFVMRPDSLADGLLSDSEASVYLVDKRVSVRFISLTNTHSSAITCNLYVKRNGSSSRSIIPVSTSIPAGETFRALSSGEIMDLSPGDDVRGDASTASKIAYVITGLQQS